MNLLNDPSTTAYIVNGILTTILGIVLTWLIERLKESSREKFDSLLKSINRIETQQEKFEDKMIAEIRVLQNDMAEVREIAIGVQESVRSQREVRDVVNRQLQERVKQVEKQVVEFGKVIRKP